MPKSHLAPMLLLALLFTACSARESDWKLDTKSMRAEYAGGETWYDIGGDLLARRSDPADDQSSVLVLVGESRGLPAKMTMDGDALTNVTSVSNEIFEKVCERGKHKLPPGVSGVFVPPNGIFREYRTRSGRTAKVHIDFAEGLAEVSINP